MKTYQHVMNLSTISCITILSFFCYSPSAYSQNKRRFTDNRAIKRYYARAGDIITFTCDSVLLLNKPSYRALDSAYTNLHARFYQLVAMSDSSNLVSKSLFESKSAQYAALKESYAQLRDSATLHVQIVNDKVEAMQQELLHTKSNLNDATQSVQVAATQIEKSNKQKWKSKLAGGLIGFGLASSLFIFTK